jgi:hypothetical protein
LLNEADRVKYRQLQQLMETLTFRTNREQVAIKFQVILSQIKQFAIRCDGDDWRRCFVCGIVWLDGAVAVNTRQLSVLMSKCKSSINAGFRAIGFTNSVMSPSQALALIREFPFFAHNSNEIRQWTIRENPSCQLHPSCTGSMTFEVSIPDLHPPCIDEYFATLPDFGDFTLSDDELDELDELDDLVEATIKYP